MSKKYLFTSESVTEGHPDKICDQISDAILDEMLKQDKNSRVAIETAVTTNTVVIMGETRTNAQVDIEKIARNTIAKIGYTKPEYEFCYNTCKVLTFVHNQSGDIAIGVDNTNKLEIGAGDQGIMFGYACSETENLMPLPITIAHALAKQLAFVRKNGTLPYLRPDGKTQVTIEYEDDKPIVIDTILISAQHDPNVTEKQLRKDLLEYVVKPIIPTISTIRKFIVNPTGKFIIGGPTGDTGLTGRKIIVDTYGGYARHGGGAFSGKDATKVDRSGAYMARHIAKSIVGNNLATKCEIEIAYGIGIAKPLSVYVNTFGTGVISDNLIADVINKSFDLRPGAIIEYLNLNSPLYSKTSVYGHFGKAELPWEKIKKL